MKERLHKIIASRGIASRRQAELMIAEGRVSCNGKVCSVGDSADPEIDVITLDGIPLPSKEEFVYLMLNKPRGYVTTLRDERGRKNVAQLVADCGKRVYPVGRLDMDSEGLLLFTNDGDFANGLMHPKHKVDKVYQVTVKNFSLDSLEKLKRPVTLDGYTIRKPSVTVVSQSGQQAQLLVTIHEGRNRQVRRMCDLAGMPVIRLIRVAEGGVHLSDLPLGKWRYLTDREVKTLQKEFGDSYMGGENGQSIFNPN